MSDLFADLSTHHGSPITLDEYIARLEALRAEHGGTVLVQKWMPSKGRHHAPEPKVAFALVKTVMKGRVAIPAMQFWQKDADRADEKGPAVIRV